MRSLDLKAIEIRLKISSTDWSGRKGGFAGWQTATALSYQKHRDQRRGERQRFNVSYKQDFPAVLATVSDA